MKEEKVPLIMKHINVVWLILRGNEDIPLIKQVSFLLGHTVLYKIYNCNLAKLLSIMEV